MRIRSILVPAAAVGAGAAIGWFTENLAMRRLVPEHGETYDELARPARDSTTGHVKASDGCRIHYREAGPPDADATIVLIHGMTLSHQIWARLQEELAADGFRVIAYDQRGHGDSDVLNMRQKYEHGLTGDLALLLEELDVRNAVLVGHSMGGMAVQAFVTTRPELRDERVAGIVLLSTPPTTRAIARDGSALPEASAERRAIFALRLTEQFERALMTIDYDYTRHARSDAGLLGTRALVFGRNAPRGAVALTLDLGVSCPAETFGGVAIGAMDGYHPLEHLPNVHTPTLVLGGDRDLLVPSWTQQVTADALPNSRFHSVRGGGHMLMFEEPEVLRRAVKDFADEVTGRS